MTKYLLILTLLCSFLANYSFANNTNVDSLITVSNRTERIELKAYQKLFEYYAKNNPDLLYEKAKELLRRALDDNNELAEITAYFYLSDYYSERGNHALALDNLNRAKVFYEQHDLKFELVELYNCIGNVHFRKGDYNEAILWYLKSMDTAQDHENTWLENLAKINLGRCYLLINDTLKGESMILDFIEQARKHERKADIANAYNVMGGYHQEKDEYDIADYYFNEALVISMNIGDKRKVAHSYNNLAISYFHQDKPELSKAYFAKALQFRIEIGDKYSISESYYNLGDWFFFQAHYDSAITYYRMSYDIAKESELYALMADALMAMTEVEKERKAYHKALEYYEEYIELKEKQFLNTKREDIAVLEFDRMMNEAKKNKLFLMKEQESLERIGLSESRSKWFILTAVFVLCFAIIMLVIRIAMENRKYTRLLDEKQLLYTELEDRYNSFSEASQARLNLVTNTLENIFLPKTNTAYNHDLICVLGREQLSATRTIQLSNGLIFYWDATLPLLESLLLFQYLEANKSMLSDATSIDELLTNQHIIEDYCIHWMLVDSNNQDVRFKSGMVCVCDGIRTSFAQIEPNTLVLSDDFPIAYNHVLKEIEVDLRELSSFSLELLNQLVEDKLIDSDVLTTNVLFYIKAPQQNA